MTQRHRTRGSALRLFLERQPFLLGRAQRCLTLAEHLGGLFELHRLAGEERGIGEEFGQLADLALELVDDARQFLEAVFLSEAEARFLRRLLRRRRRLRPFRGRGGRGGRRRGDAQRLLRLIVAPAAGIDRGAAVALHRDRRRRDAVDEVAVVADQQHGAVIFAEDVLQQIQRLDVEIVRRLVEDQQVRGLRHDPRKQKPRPFAARQRADRRARLALVEEEVLEIGHHMLRPAAHHHLVGLARDPHVGVVHHPVPERLVEIERGTRLVEDRNLEIGAERHRARVGRDLAGQHLQQRGLAHAVRADEGDAVAAQHAQVEVLHDGLVAEGLGEALRLDHPLARGARAFKLHRRGALAANLPRALGAQRLKRAHPAHVALAPRRDPLDRPFRLGLDLAIELVACLVFFGPDLLAPVLEGLEAALLPAQRAAVEPERGPRQVAQEGAVVRDQHEGGAGGLQLVLEPADRLDVEVVGGLVEQHELGRLGQKLGQRRAPPLAARGGGNRGLGAEFQPLGHHLDAVLFGLGEAGAGEIAERGKPRQVGFLLHVAHARAARHHARSLVGFDEPRHHLHQRRLARAVAADERDAVALLDGEIEPVEDGVAAEGEGDAGKLEKGCACHGSPLAGQRRKVNGGVQWPHMQTGARRGAR
ncbi:hypothetical protein SDC9_20621 [bioreactor metagenome]|uniref:Uncharacterized protein n=1 Tax=bioreactor metagenome TaxID=1076179 RepID=A0A644U7K3_9ZZZZ